MIVTAWNNGKYGQRTTTYGLKVATTDRDRYFNRRWQSAVLELEGLSEPVVVNVAKRSFGDCTCRELVSGEIGRWLQAKGKLPWKKGHPPKLVMESLGNNRFSVRFSK